MPDYYRSNLKVLKKYHPELCEAIANTSDDFSGELVESPGGFPNIKITINGKPYLLHTKSDFEHDVSSLQSLSQDRYSVVVLVGMGLGYFLTTVLNNCPNLQKIIVFEPEPWIFKQAMKAFDYMRILSDSRFIFGVGKEMDVAAVLKKANRALQMENVHIMKHQVLYRAFPDVYEALDVEIFSGINTYNIEGGTVTKHGIDFMDNRMSGLTAMHKNQMLESLAGKFSGIPAIIVAAGPSLDKNVHLLEQAKNHAVIICVDAALPALLARKIAPDFVTCIDFLELTYEKIADTAPDVSNISLICSATATRKVPKIYPFDHVFWAFPARHIDEWFCLALGGSMAIPGAGTVAHLNLIAAKILGCSEIIFVGQDLSYPDKQNYASGVSLLINDAVKRRLENKTDDIVWVEGNLGKKVPASRQFFSHIKKFEEMIANIPERVINATEGGARISGTEIMTLENALAECCKDTIVDIQSVITSVVKDAAIPDSDNLYKSMTAIRGSLKELKALVLKAEKIGSDTYQVLTRMKKTGKNIKRFQQFSQSVQKKLSGVDRINNLIDSKREVWPLLYELTMDSLKQTERMKVEAEALKGNPETFLLWLMKNIERVSFVNSERKKIIAYLDEKMETAIRFHDDEARQFSHIQSDPSNPEPVMALVRLYCEAGDWVLAKPYMEKLTAMGYASGELSAYRGMLAALHTKFEAASVLFDEAMAMDTAMAGKIKSFCLQQGHSYLAYANRYKELSRSTFARMLKKGLWFMPSHGGLRIEIEQLIDSEVALVDKGVEDVGNIDREVIDRLKSWKDLCDIRPDLVPIIGKIRIAGMYRVLGRYLARSGDLEGARNAVEGAVSIAPENPGYHVQLTDILFSMGLFSDGVVALDKAVALDNSYGKLWENIGDNLAAATDLDGAIAAYEKCSRALPDYRQPLDKIERCIQIKKAQTSPGGD